MRAPACPAHSPGMDPLMDQPPSPPAEAAAALPARLARLVRELGARTARRVSDPPGDEREAVDGGDASGDGVSRAGI